MKKTKIAAIVACAALLVLGMAFTAMAANKWVFENGGWFAVDKDGEAVEFTWGTGQDGVKYWADEDGAWAVNAWVDDETTYVGADGKKAEGWLKLANEDEDVEDYGDYSWYYFTNGKPKAETTTAAALINGARYCFDDTGRMMYGWISTTNDMLDPDDDGIATAKYYCGGEDEGWATTGWQYLYAPTGDDDETDPYYWFYFGSKGVIIDDEKKTIDGEKYTFDTDGRMLTGWVPANASAASASYAQESGAALKKGWVWAVGTSVMKTYIADDEAEHWFWFNKAGALVFNTMTNANKSKTTWFALDPQGTMLAGLYKATVSNGVTLASETVPAVLTAGIKIPEYADALGVAPVTTLAGTEYYFYFGDEATDGSMKTGDQTITIDGEDYTLRFSKGAKDKYYIEESSVVKSVHYVLGASVTGFQGSKYYLNGQVLCGGDEDQDTTYSFVETKAITKDYVIPQTTAGALKEAAAPGKKSGSDKKNGYYPVDVEDICVVTDAGKFLKSGTVKDDDGNKWKIENYEVTGYKPAE